MSDPKTKVKEEKPTEETYGPSILEDLLELLSDKEDYRF